MPQEKTVTTPPRNIEIYIIRKYIDDTRPWIRLFNGYEHKRADEAIEALNKIEDKLS